MLTLKNQIFAFKPKFWYLKTKFSTLLDLQTKILIVKN